MLDVGSVGVLEVYVDFIFRIDPEGGSSMCVSSQKCVTI
jgi:hypothetical protein